MTRVSGPDVEEAVCKALRQHRSKESELDDRALVEQSFERIVVKTGHISIELASDNIDESADADVPQVRKPHTITAPFIVRGTARKGYLHQPHSQPAMTTETREILLKAIARARKWLDEI